VFSFSICIEAQNKLTIGDAREISIMPINRVLVIEGNKACREVLVNTPQSCGLQIDARDVANTGIECIVLANEEKQPYDLVVMD